VAPVVPRGRGCLGAHAWVPVGRGAKIGAKCMPLPASKASFPPPACSRACTLGWPGKASVLCLKCVRDDCGISIHPSLVPLRSLEDTQPPLISLNALTAPLSWVPSLLVAHTEQHKLRELRDSWVTPTGAPCTPSEGNPHSPGCSLWLWRMRGCKLRDVTSTGTFPFGTPMEGGSGGQGRAAVSFAPVSFGVSVPLPLAVKPWGGLPPKFHLHW